MAPRTSAERLVSEICASLLEVDRVSIRDHFFNDLGGHSLLATRLVARLGASLGLEVPVRVVFDAPILAELASVVAAVASDGGRGATSTNATRSPLSSPAHR